MKLFCLILISVLVCACSKEQNSINFKYSVTIPPDVPEILTTTPSTEGYYERANGHMLYKKMHQNGWDCCIKDFLRDKLGERPEPYGITLMPFEKNARDAGFQQCKKAINQLVGKHGIRQVRRFLLEYRLKS